MNLKKLTRPAFRKWLESQPPRRQVGIATKNNRCPIATYMGDGVPYLEAPIWARRYMDELDESLNHCPLPVSAAKALKILERVS